VGKLHRQSLIKVQFQGVVQPFPPDVLPVLNKVRIQAYQMRVPPVLESLSHHGVDEPNLGDIFLVVFGPVFIGIGESHGPTTPG
jgi:hypothetical protein